MRHPPRPPRCCRLAARRLVARAAADVGADQSSPSAVRKALLARGWDLAWIDGVTGEMIKGRLSASVPQIDAAVGARGVGAVLLHVVQCLPCALCSTFPTPLGTLPLAHSIHGQTPVIFCACCVMLPLLYHADRLPQVSYLEGLGIPLKAVENMAGACGCAPAPTSVLR